MTTTSMYSSWHLSASSWAMDKKIFRNGKYRRHELVQSHANVSLVNYNLLPLKPKKNYAVLEIYADCEYFQKYLVADINI